MTAIEWFIKEIEKHDKEFSSFYGAEITQAKEMHKKEIISAFNQGMNFSVDYFKPETNTDEANNYYNETFKKD